MNLEKVIFGFFVLLAATLNFGFFIGDIDDPALHNVYELFAAVVVNLIATVLKFGDRTQIGAVHLATSLVADLQLIAAALVWGYATHVSAEGLTAGGDGQRGVAVRRRAAGQHRVGGAAGDRDRVVPPGGRRRPWATRCWCSGAGCSTGDEPPERRTPPLRVPMASATQASATIFLILRRMRAPLIVLIVIFAVSVARADADPRAGRRRAARGAWASSTPSTS